MSQITVCELPILDARINLTYAKKLGAGNNDGSSNPAQSPSTKANPAGPTPCHTRF